MSCDFLLTCSFEASNRLRVLAFFDDETLGIARGREERCHSSRPKGDISETKNVIACDADANIPTICAFSCKFCAISPFFKP